MKETHGWWWPDHERHMPEWMDSPKNRLKLNGRWTYQGRKQSAVLELCPRNGNAIDVGGHVGLWSFNFAHHFDHVYAFEPVAEHRECFEANVKMPNVTLLPYALGEAPAMVGMWTQPGSSGNTQVQGAGDVEMRTLDSFAFVDVRLIKIDCEGYEEKVLRGAVDTLARCKPTVIVEQKRDMAKRFNLELRGAVTFLEQQGYKVVQEISGDFIMVPRA